MEPNGGVTPYRECSRVLAVGGWRMADASKWERFASVKVASLSRFSRIFTNKTGLTAELLVSMVESDP
ncbi:hypothetical protein [Enterovibrio norvegicus]|uniref:HTH araC/xylS-type domain-containing protein n=1 Tax=Enterovibrio norvegicus TaxID=188144 RepID=A0ABV4L756_9GAMM|nr:hypothetical protein [Enterovibrio norvegicus]